MPLKPLPLTKNQRRRLRQLDELLAWAETQIASWPLPDNLILMVIAQQAGGVHRLARAVLAQIRGGSTDQLESRMRAFVESAINVRYILAGDSEARARAFANEDVVKQRAIANHFASLVRQGKAPSMARLVSPDFWSEQATRLTGELTEIEAEHGRVSDGWPPILERAKRGDSEELYATLFRLWSEDEHLTTRGLDKHMRIRDGQAYFDFGQDVTRLSSIIGMTYIYYLTTLRLLGERTGNPSDAALLRFASIDREIRGELAPVQMQALKGTVATLDAEPII